MKRTSFLLAFALAASAGIAGAQVQRFSWDSPSFGTPSVRDLVQSQPAPSAPKGAPVAPSAPAAQASSAACPDAPELAGRSIQIVLNLKGEEKPLIIDFAYDACHIEYPRDEPVVPPYTYRSYKSAKGDVLGLYSSSDRPTTNVYFHLADGRNSVSGLPIYANADLASGRALDFGDIILVKSTIVIRATGSIKSVPAK